MNCPNCEKLISSLNGQQEVTQELIELVRFYFNVAKNNFESHKTCGCCPDPQYDYLRGKMDALEELLEEVE